MESSDPESQVTIERRISKDKLAKYKGSALVAIAHLAFPHPCRQVDRKIIEQLKRDFEGEGCKIEEPNNRIPAIIDDPTLQEVLEKLATSAETFRAASKGDPPRLQLDHNVKLECLHGQHRVLAAKEFLLPPRRWWVVDLYSTDLENETKQAFREGFSYSAPYASGEIFRQIRLCHYNKDDLGEQQWRAKLSLYQEKYLNIILKRKILLSALDSVLHIRGLWRTFYIGSLNEFITIGCDEEIKRYINTIRSVWMRFLGGDMVIMMNTDPYTVGCIQSRAPALSNSDFQYVEERMKPGKGELFPEVSDPVRRAQIKARLLSIKEIIPSLWTLISDIRYLKQPAKVLKTLLPPVPRKGKNRKKNTLRERFYFHFTQAESSDGTIEIQKAASSYTTIPLNSLDSFELSYQQLWLCSYRVSKNLNAYGSLQLATLAHRLGFQSPEIERELRQDPAYDIVQKAALDALKVLRPNEAFVFDADQARPVITSLKNYLSKVLEAPMKSGPPFITVAGSGEPLNRRCGYGSTDTQDLNHLFLGKIHAPLQEHQKGGDEISSFYVKQSRHIAFFGVLNLAGDYNPDPSTNKPAMAASPAETMHLPSVIVEPTSPMSVSEEHDPNPNSGFQIVNQISSSGRQVVRFIQNGAIQEVLNEREPVTNQAREYANLGKSLSLIEGGSFFWQACFDVLIRTGHSTVIVSDAARPMPPVTGKRHRSQNLIDRP
ncbi:hypothetical protein BGZ60DRAFT_403952 [Tricladium varicosporioides]|nr:hypothetical protein BGZ60DRAFT_403952 [Hymenoscyphus varicosporioides]